MVRVLSFSTYCLIISLQAGKEPRTRSEGSSARSQCLLARSFEKISPDCPEQKCQRIPAAEIDLSRGSHRRSADDSPTGSARVSETGINDAGYNIKRRYSLYGLFPSSSGSCRTTAGRHATCRGALLTSTRSLTF